MMTTTHPVRSIRTHFLLAMAALVLTLSLPLLYSGGKLLDNIIQQLASELLLEKLQALLAPVDRRYETLSRMGLQESRLHLDGIRQSAIGEFSRYRYMETGAVLVIGKDGDLVLGEYFAGRDGDEYQALLALLKERPELSRQSEIIHYHAAGQRRFVAVRFYEPWQSYVGICVSEQELFAPLNTFYRINLLVLAVVLLIAALFTLVLHYFLVIPLIRLTDYATRISGGDYSATAAGTFHLELKRLRDNIAAMVVSLRSKMEETASQLGVIQERELSRTFAELRESEERYRTIFNAPSDAIFIHEVASARLVDVNRAMLEMFGYDYNEALQLNIGELSSNIPPYTLKEARCYLAATKRKGAQRFEWQSRRKDGELFWTDVALRRTSFRNRDYIIAVIRDINRRKLNEQALAHEKERLTITLQSIGDGVITTDRQGRVMLLNDVAGRLTGWKQEEAVGRPLPEVFNIVNERRGVAGENPAERVLSEGNILTLQSDTVLIARDGAKRPIADSAAPIRDQSGVIIGVALVFRDMTEQQRTQQELFKVKKLEAVGVLAAGIAHDFNNLLTAIMGNVDLARFLLKDNDEIDNLLGEAGNACRRARGLTQQLLTFSRGGAPIRKVASLEAVIRDSTAFVLRGSGVSCEYEIPGDLWLVEIDQGQISQVIQNIVLNARQAMGGSGRIVISCRNLVNRADAVERWRGEFVAISISDNGPGIPPDDQERIFDPYYTTREGGSGLGLAICHSIIEKHGGHIEVVSRPESGTTFTIMLPASRDRIVADEEISAPRALSRRARILVMDDEEMILDLLRRALEYLGHQVQTVENGEQALTAYQEALVRGTPFDLVIMDLTVPGGMGGLETAGRLRELNPTARIVVASGYADDPVMADYQLHGFDGRLNKPFLLADLTDVIRRLLED